MPHRSKLQAYLGQWQHLRKLHGAHMPEVHLYWMLMDVLPDDVATEIRDRKHYLKTVGSVIHWIQGELSRYRDKEISSLQDKHAQHMLSTGPRNPVNSFAEAEDKVKGMMEKMEDLVNALNSPDDRVRLPKPDPKFEGCWHCGFKLHTRRKCPQFRDILKRNEGKLPNDYTGAYERFMKNTANLSLPSLHRRMPTQ